MTRFKLTPLFLAATTLTALACTPTVGLGGDDPDGGGNTVTGDAGTLPSTDAASADVVVPTAEFPRIDVRLETFTRADGYPAQLAEGVTVAIAYYKRPTKLSDERSGPLGCSERTVTTYPGPPAPDQGLTTFGQVIATAQAAGGKVVPVALDPQSSTTYIARLGILPDGTDVTITMDPSAREIGGRSFTIKSRAFRITAPTPPTQGPYKLDYPASQAFSLQWQPVEGPIYYSLSDLDTIGGPNNDATNSRYLDCWTGPGVHTSTVVDAASFAKLHWSPPVASSNNGMFYALSVLSETASGPTGSVVNVSSLAGTTAFVNVQ